ncbi:hypothetical protein WJX73_001019 [Symbiochloris irregularis]|uniref:AB hydrolase-1 domain-containing protein n=1 Tax=Symbiochloris irregularis TaxID=706552 RepID=A0AAW1P437_9CHLO
MSRGLRVSPLLLAASLALLAGLCQAQVPGSLSTLAPYCFEKGLPAAYQPYLDTSFLGEEQHALVGTVNYSYYQFGPLQQTSSPGRPLIMITGSGATYSDWTPDLLSGLAQNREVIIFDNRGIGRSTDSYIPPNGLYTLGDYASSTVDFIAEIGLEQPDALGWSLGGFILLTMLVDFNGNETLSHAILANTAAGGPGYIESPDSYADYGDSDSEPLGFLYPDTQTGLDGLCRLIYFNPAMPDDEPTDAQENLQNINFPTVNDTSISSKLGGITNPVLVLTGAQDQIVATADAYQLANGIPGSIFLQYQDSGHATLQQHALSFPRFASAFLDESEAQINPQ